MNKVMPERDLPPGVWQELLLHALRIIDDIKKHGTIDPFWTFGGGTVLMLRYQHRMSKDIDIFVPDPQYLGFLTPRLSDVAADVSSGGFKFEVQQLMVAWCSTSPLRIILHAVISPQALCVAGG